MSVFLYQLGRACVHHRWRTIGAWLITSIVLIGLNQAVGGELTNGFVVPDFDSQHAYDLLADRFPTEGGIKFILVEGVLQPIRLHQLRMLLTILERMNVVSLALFIDVDDDIEAQILARIALAKRDHLLELPCRINMHQRKGRVCRIECLLRQTHHDG